MARSAVSQSVYRAPRSRHPLRTNCWGATSQLSSVTQIHCPTSHIDWAGMLGGVQLHRGRGCTSRTSEMGATWAGLIGDAVGFAASATADMLDHSDPADDQPNDKGHRECEHAGGAQRRDKHLDPRAGTTR